MSDKLKTLPKKPKATKKRKRRNPSRSIATKSMIDMLKEANRRRCNPTPQERIVDGIISAIMSFVTRGIFPLGVSQIVTDGEAIDETEKPEC